MEERQMRVTFPNHRRTRSIILERGIIPIMPISVWAAMFNIRTAALGLTLRLMRVCKRGRTWAMRPTLPVGSHLLKLQSSV